MNPQLRQRIAVGLLSISAAGFAAWQANEGLTTTAVIPTPVSYTHLTLPTILLV